MSAPKKIPTAAALLALLGRHSCNAETYGHKTYLYLSWHTAKEKLEKEAMLQSKGYEVDLEYGYANPTRSAVRVSTIRKGYGRTFTVRLVWSDKYETARVKVVL